MGHSESLLTRVNNNSDEELRTSGLKKGIRKIYQDDSLNMDWHSNCHSCYFNLSSDENPIEKYRGNKIHCGSLVNKAETIQKLKKKSF